MKRRTFLRTTTTALLGFQVVPRHVLGQGLTPPSGKLNVAGVGVGGRGAADLSEMKGENVVALCDVDERQAAGTFNAFPKADGSRIIA